MPDVTRRSMLAMGAAALGAGMGSVALGSPGTALAALAPDRDAPGGSVIPGRSAFVPALGSLFTVRTGDARHTLRLAEILDVPPVADVEHSFNLVFEAVSTRPVPDGIYRFTSVKVRACELFVSAVEAPGGRIRLQALVNRHTA